MSEKKEETNKQEKRRERKNNRINLRITDSEIEGLNMVSINDDEPISQVVRKAIKMYINMRKNAY